MNYGVTGWVWDRELATTEDYLRRLGVTWDDDCTYTTSDGHILTVQDCVEAIARVLINATAISHTAYNDDPSWTWTMTHDAVWGWECEHGYTTDYVSEELPWVGDMMRHEAEAIVRLAMRFVAHDAECAALMVDAIADW